MGRAYQNRKESMAKTAAMKTAVYSRYSREIYMAAKGGGTDPSANLTLRSLIDRAKKDQVPSHVIEKAIDKASSGVGEDFQIARYEGFGPGGTMLLVDCLTDNANRTIGEVRPALPKAKGRWVHPGPLLTCSSTQRCSSSKGMKRPCLSASLWPTLTCWKLRAKTTGLP